jgi:hypothetical protein
MVHPLNLFIVELEIVAKPRDEIVQIHAPNIVETTHIGLTKTDYLRIILTSSGHDFRVNTEDIREFIGTARDPAFLTGVKYAGGDDTRSVRTSGDLGLRYDLIQRFSGLTDHLW